MKVLRPYQLRAVNHLWEAFDNKEKIVLAAPTGAGKTAIAANIIAEALRQKKRVAFTIPFISLVDQSYKAFVAEGVSERDISIVQAANPLCDYRKKIQLCSVDTLVRRQLPEVDVVFFDEAHRQSKLYSRWMQEYPQANFAALSATPWSRGMADIWDRLEIVSTTRELIKQGYLCDYKYYAPVTPDLSGVRIVAGDFHEGDLGGAMNKPELVADIIQTWRTKSSDRPTLCFCVTLAHAREVQSKFLEEGIACGYVDAHTSVRERAELVEQLRVGDLKVIVNVGTMTTGLDAPWIGTIILARPTKSEMLFLQIIGRGLRTHASKDHLLVLDHSSTGLNLGLPCTIHHDELLSGKVSKEQRAREKQEAKDKTVKPHKCVKCNHLHDQSIMVCPSCGHVRRKVSDVVMREGFLGELSRDGTQKTSHSIDRAMRQDWYSGLLYICMERNYSAGWAFYKFKEKFNASPDGYDKIAKPPSMAVRSWVRSRQIAYAKGKAKAALKDDPRFRAGVDKMMQRFTRD